MNNAEFNKFAGHLHALEVFLVGITNELITHDRLNEQRTTDYLNSRLLIAHPADPNNPDHQQQFEAFQHHMQQMIGSIRGR